VWITSKLQPKDMSSESDVYKAALFSLKNLQLEYLDLYLIHWPARSGIPATSSTHALARQQAWRALERLHSERKCRHIGVSNYTIAHLTELLSYAKVKPYVNQVEFHPLCVQYTLASFCAQHSIVLQAYSPFAQGSTVLLRHPVLQSIAKQHNVAVCDIILQWFLYLRLPLVVKSASLAHTKSNFKILNVGSSDSSVCTQSQMVTAPSDQREEIKVPSLAFNSKSVELGQPFQLSDNELYLITSLSYFNDATQPFTELDCQSTESGSAKSPLLKWMEYVLHRSLKLTVSPSIKETQPEKVRRFCWDPTVVT